MQINLAVGRNRTFLRPSWGRRNTDHFDGNGQWLCLDTVYWIAVLGFYLELTIERGDDQ